MKSKQKNVLAKELEYFKKNRAELLKSHRGKFLLIKNGKLVGSFTTEQEAYTAGVQKFGNDPFLIKRAIEKDLPASVPALTLGVLNVSL